MALQFYAQGKSWQEKMLDQEKWHNLGRDLGAVAGLGTEAAYDKWSMLGRAYGKYSEKVEGRVDTLDNIKRKMKVAYDEGMIDKKSPIGKAMKVIVSALTPGLFLHNLPEDASESQIRAAQDIEKAKIDKQWSSDTFNKKALEWGKTYAPEDYAKLDLKEDYKFSPKTFELMGRPDFKKSTFGKGLISTEKDLRKERWGKVGKAVTSPLRDVSATIGKIPQAAGGLLQKLNPFQSKLEPVSEGEPDPSKLGYDPESSYMDVGGTVPPTGGETDQPIPRYLSVLPALNDLQTSGNWADVMADTSNVMTGGEVGGFDDSDYMNRWEPAAGPDSLRQGHSYGNLLDLTGLPAAPYQYDPSSSIMMRNRKKKTGPKTYSSGQQRVY